MIGNLAGKLSRVPAFLVARRMASIPPGRRIVSITFDDFPRTALDNGGPVLAAHGVRATFYTAFGLAGTDTPVGRVGRPSELAACVDQGHEIACHTYDHVDCARLTERGIDETIRRNQEVARGLGLPPFRHFAYPFGRFSAAAKRVAMRHYATARRSGSAINRGRIDLGMLKSAPVYSQLGRDCLAPLFSSLRSAGGWLIFHTHDVSSRPTQYGCTPEDLDFVLRHAREAGAEMMTVGAALDTLVAAAA
jgi:peptidoglycan/xylan/chitin deacetylase (PgdA/CDA1 family)